MITISAFADEISPDLQEQMDGCERNGIKCIDLRGINQQNVSTFSLDAARGYRRQLDDRGFTVPCIGSPIGKIRLDDDFDAHLHLLKHCFDLAHVFGTRRIRIFSFYAAEDGKPVIEEREAVFSRMARMIDAAEAADMVLLHENEKAIYGAHPDGVRDLLTHFRSPHFKGIFDPANFVEEGVRPYDEGWAKGLAELTDYFHVKDKTPGAPTCVPAGEGEGQFDAIFADLAKRGWDGYMTLEPHMKEAAQFAGFSGPEKFRLAAEGLKAVCRKAGITYR